MSHERESAKIAQAAERIRSARQVCCLTGAGISAESGIPTFRDNGGFWEGRRPEELASPEGFAHDPETVWRFYLMRRRQLITKKPNPGHFALADIERRVSKFTLVTQNVDGLHRMAGSRNVLELHGDLMIDRCTQCTHKVRRTPADSFEQIPYCERCTGMMRPGVVWFGEMLPAETLRAAEAAAGECDVMLVVGTSAVVMPAAMLADWAKSNGAFVIEVNPRATPLTGRVDIAFARPAGEVLPYVAASLTDRPVGIEKAPR